MSDRMDPERERQAYGPQERQRGERFPEPRLTAEELEAIRAEHLHSRFGMPLRGRATTRRERDWLRKAGRR